MSKDSIRKTILAGLASLDGKERSQIESTFYERLFSTDLWKKAESIGVTVSKGTEWETRPIIEEAWKEEKKVSVPKSIHKTRELHFYQLEDYNQLEVGYYDLEEPVPEKTNRTEIADIDLLIVPGVAFNKEGYRIGFGGGYYDRFLKDFSNETVSLAHTNQLREDLPIEEYDLPVDKIITEQGIIDCKEKR